MKEIVKGIIQEYRKANYVLDSSQIVDVSIGTLAHITGLTSYHDLDKFKSIVSDWYMDHLKRYSTWMEELDAFAKENGIRLEGKASGKTLNHEDVKRLIQKPEKHPIEKKVEKKHWAIVKNKQVMTSGSMVGTGIDYLRALAKKYNGELVFNDQSFSQRVDENEPLYFGMTWDTLNRKQHQR